jgi:beta-1,4-mannosyltransferase
MRDRGVRRPIVLQSFGRPGPTTNPYITQLLEAVSEHLDVHVFSWRTAFMGRYDVFHVHWPERLIRGTSRWRSTARVGLFALLLISLRLRRQAVVRTVHNERPHESGSRLERWVLHRCDRQTALWIALNDHTRTPGPAPVATIPHGHYRDWAARFAATGADVVEPRVLFFGLIRRYKGVDELLTAFAGVREPETTLRIVGQAMDATAEATVRTAADRDGRISARIEYVPDAELVEEIVGCRLVALPYRAMHNSGAVLLALSLDRPVLVPDNEVTAALADEVGPGWVIRYSGDLTADRLSSSLRAAAVRPTRRPALDRRGWAAAGAAHADAYRRAAELSGRRIYEERR